jgi:hypothetical protein
MTVTAKVQEKAGRLVAEGKVVHLKNGHCTERRCEYRVQGDHGVYRVLLGDRWASCTCPAVRTCSHIKAALDVEAQRRAAATTL